MDPIDRPISRWIEQWKQEQSALREKMIVAPLDPLPRYVAGADAAFSDTHVYAVATVYDRETQTLVETAHAREPLRFPYVPGYLSFREGPAVMAALRKLTHEYGAVLFDGQGYAHPRRCGLATHVGVTLDIPAVGCAKSRLIGAHGTLATMAGSGVDLIDKGERVGTVLRTRDDVNPLFISVGHRVDLATAEKLVLACRTRYRMPEPTRIADRDVAAFKKEAEGPKIPRMTPIAGMK